MTATRPELQEWLAARRQAVDEALDAVVPATGEPAVVWEAMRYSLFAGGKRLRPLLVLASAKMFEVPERQSLRAGLSVEAIHAHSLIHDDLPCMDDDDLRRGRPAVHRAFDEATAVLAGDSLLALACQILAEPETHPNPHIRNALVVSIARADFRPRPTATRNCKEPSMATIAS